MKKLIGSLVLLVLGLSLPLLVFEFAVWHVPQPRLPAVVRDQLQEIAVRSEKVYATDPDLGFVMRPGVNVEFAWEESSYRLKTNLNYEHAGFRGGTLGGPPWGIALGDSFTFGTGVNQPATWVALLADHAGRDMVNLGVMGYGPQQYTRTLEKYGVALRPKFVLYCLFANDLRDTHVFANWIGKSRGGFSLKDYLSENSVVYNLFHRMRRHQKQGSKYVSLDEVGQKLSLRKLKQEILADAKRVPLALPVVVQEIEKARQISARAGAKFVLLYFPSKEEVYWDLAKQQMPDLAELDGREQQFADSIVDHCMARQLDCLDLTAALKKKGRVKLYFSVDSHWNELGHQTVALEIYRYLSAEKFL